MKEDWAMEAALAISRELVLDIPDHQLERAAQIIRDAATNEATTLSNGDRT